MRLAAGLCLSAPPNPLAAKRGPTSKGGDGGERGREGREEEGRGRKGGRKGTLLISGQRGLFP